ncbi:Kinase A inhibitor [Mycobacteroides abscessus]|nr:Kinase A inhibitor [Mycobacteroides abscessus]
MSTATDLKVRDHGDRALLLECTSVHEVLAWTSALNADPIEGVTDIVPAPALSYSSSTARPTSRWSVIG